MDDCPYCCRALPKVTTATASGDSTTPDQAIGEMFRGTTLLEYAAGLHEELTGFLGKIEKDCKISPAQSDHLADGLDALSGLLKARRLASWAPSSEKR